MGPRREGKSSSEYLSAERLPGMSQEIKKEGHHGKAKVVDRFKQKRRGYGVR
jgi:hypothetical protein